jgi:hypothetical protein
MRYIKGFMKITTILRIIIAVIIAGIVNDFIHIYYGHFADGITIYNSFINTMSFLTKPIEALGVALVYYLIGDRLYSNSRLIKAIWLTILVCLIKDGLIRQPFMNILLGNPVLDSLYRESQVWLSSLVMSLVLTFMINPRNENKIN